MVEHESSSSTQPHDEVQAQGFWDRHAKLAIWLIAGVFYVVLFGMCLGILALVWFRA